MGELVTAASPPRAEPQVTAPWSVVPSDTRSWAHTLPRQRPRFYSCVSAPLPSDAEPTLRVEDAT